jgi:sugar phosphate isomerase/epimerase
LNKNRIAAQLYTLRDHLKTPEEIARTLRKVKQIGYDAVQVSGMGPIAEEDLLRILQAEGLVCCATHEGNILSEPERVVERLRKLECRYTAYPYPGGVKLETMEDVKAFAQRLNKAGEIIREGGAILSYHNHSIEFRRIEGRLMIEILYEETDPRYLQAELDTYWVQYGGGDPVDWCQRMKKRLPLIHLKDYATDAGSKPVFAEVGQGNLDWRRIIPEAASSGCEWFIVEQDVCPGDPFDSLRISLEYLKENFCD